MAASVELPVLRRPAIDRLSSQDVANLVIEAADTPMHMAVLTILDGAGLRGSSADEVLEMARDHVSACLDRLPELRQVLHQARFPAGRPVWVDDPGFRIDRNVLGARVAPPGGEVELLATTATLLERLLDRSKPLWELWVVSGLRDARLALLLKVHHAMADGLGMLRIADVLFDAAPVRRDIRRDRWTPAPAPSWARLTMAMATDAARGAWRTAAATAHPIRMARSAAGIVTTIGSVTHRTWAGHRAPLRRPLGTHRKLAVLRLDLPTVKRVGHAHDAKVNDVVLELAAAAVEGALRSRGQVTNDGGVLRALVAVNPPLPVAGRRNRAGAVLVSLPVDGAEGFDRLHAIAVDSVRARRWQHAAVVERFLVFVARVGVGRFLSRHQAAVELAVSNLRGPSAPIYFLGCPVVDAIPSAPISGNVTIDFCALSYAGRFNIAVLADEASWPDLEVAMEAMRSAWRRLSRAAALEAAP